MSSLEYLEIACIVGWVPQEIDFEMNYTCTVFTKECPQEQHVRKGGEKNRNGQREVKVRQMRTNDSFVQPQGSSGPRTTLQNHCKLSPDGLAFNLLCCSVFEYGLPQQPKQSLKRLTVEGCLLKVLPRAEVKRPLMMEQLGSTSQYPPNITIAIKHQLTVHSNLNYPSNLPSILLSYFCTQDYIMVMSALSSQHPCKKKINK